MSKYERLKRSVDANISRLYAEKEEALERERVKKMEKIRQAEDNERKKKLTIHNHALVMEETIRILTKINKEVFNSQGTKLSSTHFGIDGFSKRTGIEICIWRVAF